MFGGLFITMLLLTPKDRCACSKGGCLPVLFMVYLQNIYLKSFYETICKISVAFCAVSIFLILFLFPFSLYHCVSYYIGVLIFYSIFQMIIVFPFIVLKYFSFCCHSSHSVLFWNPLVYSCFVLFFKSDSKLNQNSSC